MLKKRQKYQKELFRLVVACSTVCKQWEQRHFSDRINVDYFRFDKINIEMQTLTQMRGKIRDGQANAWNKHGKKSLSLLSVDNNF